MPERFHAPLLETELRDESQKQQVQVNEAEAVIHEPPTVGRTEESVTPETEGATLPLPSQTRIPTTLSGQRIKRTTRLQESELLPTLTSFVT